MNHLWIRAPPRSTALGAFGGAEAGSLFLLGVCGNKGICYMGMDVGAIFPDSLLIPNEDWDNKYNQSFVSLTWISRGGRVYLLSQITLIARPTSPVILSRPTKSREGFENIQ